MFALHVGDKVVVTIACMFAKWALERGLGVVGPLVLASGARVLEPFLAVRYAARVWPLIGVGSSLVFQEVRCRPSDDLVAFVAMPAIGSNGGFRVVFQISAGT